MGKANRSDKDDTKIPLTAVTIDISTNNKSRTIKKIFNDDWDILAFEISRDSLSNKNYTNIRDNIPELHYHGIYFLVSEDNKRVYVGKGTIRKYNEGVVRRVKDHVNAYNEPYYDKWNRAIIITSKYKTDDHYLAWTDNTILALEHFMIKEFKEDNRFNGNDGNHGGNKRESFEELIEQIKISLIAFGIDKTIFINEHKYKIASILNMTSAEYDKYNKFEYIGEYKRSTPEIITPSRIVRAMIDMLPDDIWNDTTTFLDPACKNGEFLREIFDRLMKSPFMKSKYPNITVRTLHILSKQIYGIALSNESQKKTIQTLSQGVFGSNVKCLTNYVEKVKSGKFRDIVREAFGCNMNFDVVISNPPYNKGADLDFVNLGYELSELYTIMLTPAKWQTAAENQRLASSTINYGTFREKIVPHMNKVVFYPNCSDIFEINERSGISYYLIDKNNTYNEKCIINICNNQKYYNSEVMRSLGDRETLHNIGFEIINYLRKRQYESFKFDTDINKRYHVYTNSQSNPERGIKGTYQAYGVISYATGQSKVLGASEIIDSKDKIAMEFKVEASTLSFASDDENECYSFLSWLNSKFVRFFIMMNISKMTCVDDDTFRFVPALPKSQNTWKYKYTDAGLYKYYGLDEPDAQTKDGVRYTDIIEAVIKERE
ncbi:MAG: Eco57I restriction-modification methylase domain-containing protein [Ruminococcus sp.]|nr:Eco57I restriction-modification methylase domain-containing protein [Ruminococcus sp.]